MLLIPQKLIHEDFINIYFESPKLIFCQKRLHQSLNGREAYISMHALSMVFEGEQHIRTYEGEVMSVKPGDYALFKKGIYSISDLLSTNNQFRSYLIFFDEEILSKLFSYLPPQNKTTPQVNLSVFKQPEYTQHFWSSIRSIHKDFDSTANQLFPIKFQELFSILAADNSQFANTLSQIPQRNPSSLKEFMDKNFDKPLSIEDYAYLTGRSESTFRREFKNKFGITPRKWIILQRMEKAKHLLSSTKWEVGRIAMEVGYENTSHFISEFKKHFGYTPGQEMTQSLRISDRKTAS